MNRLRLKKAVIYASIIGTVLNEYELHERTKQITAILNNVQRFLLITRRKQPVIYLEALEVANKAWVDTVLHYREHDKKLESVTVINEFYGEAREYLRKYAKLSIEMINQFSDSYDGEIVDSYEVSDYLIDKVYEALGETRESTWALKN